MVMVIKCSSPGAIKPSVEEELRHVKYNHAGVGWKFGKELSAQAARHHLIHGPMPVRGTRVADHWHRRLTVYRGMLNLSKFKVLMLVGKFEDGLNPAQSHSLSSLLNYLRAFGDRPVTGVPGGQGIESWLACARGRAQSHKRPAV
ncbi:hypothetical protein TNCV_118061 [Trichonephila clavipes]|nr:hypothetical protein TNCV_118061 [Trichonephila clavipes]